MKKGLHACGNIRFKWTFVALLPVFAIISTSCSGGQTNQPSGKNSESQAPVAATKDWTKDPVELTFFYMYNEDLEEGFRKGDGARIQKKYPNVTFKFMKNAPGTTLADIVTTKTKIDFFGDTQSGVAKLREVGMLDDDISDLVKKHKFDLSKIEPSAINAYTYAANGVLTGLPIKINSTTLYYNKDIFDKFGVPYLTDNMMWDSVIDTARKLTRVDGGVPYYGLGINIGNTLFVNEGVPSLVNMQTKKATLATDYWKKMFERNMRMLTLSSDADANNMLANYGKAFVNFYKDRNIAIQVGNNSAFNIIGQNSDGLRWDIANFPTYNDMPNAGPNSNPYGYFISKNSPNREMAFLAISALLNEDSQLEAARTNAYVPVIKDRSYLNTIGDAVPELQGKNAKGLVPKKYGESIPTDKYISAATSSLNTAFYDVVAGKKDINSALRDAEEAANQKISTLPQ